MSTNNIIIATNSNFPELLTQHSKVLVDFWAPWCGPCQAIGPILEALAAEDFCPIIKVNVDECPELAKEYNIRAVPTLLLFVDKKVAGTKVGAVAKPEIIELVESN